MALASPHKPKLPPGVELDQEGNHAVLIYTSPEIEVVYTGLVGADEETLQELIEKGVLYPPTPYYREHYWPYVPRAITDIILAVQWAALARTDPLGGVTLKRKHLAERARVDESTVDEYIRRWEDPNTQGWEWDLFRTYIPVIQKSPYIKGAGRRSWQFIPLKPGLDVLDTDQWGELDKRARRYREQRRILFDAPAVRAKSGQSTDNPDFATEQASNSQPSRLSTADSPDFTPAEPGQSRDDPEFSQPSSRLKSGESSESSDFEQPGEPAKSEDSAAQSRGNPDFIGARSPDNAAATGRSVPGTATKSGESALQSRGNPEFASGPMHACMHAPKESAACLVAAAASTVPVPDTIPEELPREQWDPHLFHEDLLLAYVPLDAAAAALLDRGLAPDDANRLLWHHPEAPKWCWLWCEWTKAAEKRLFNVPGYILVAVTAACEGVQKYRKPVWEFAKLRRERKLPELRTVEPRRQPLATDDEPVDPLLLPEWNRLLEIAKDKKRFGSASGFLPPCRPRREGGLWVILCPSSMHLQILDGKRRALQEAFGQPLEFRMHPDAEKRGGRR